MGLLGYLIMKTNYFVSVNTNVSFDGRSLEGYSFVTNATNQTIWLVISSLELSLEVKSVRVYELGDIIEIDINREKLIYPEK